MIQEMVASLPIPALKSIYKLLLEAFHVEVPYSNDPLEMAQTAFARQKASVSQVLDTLYEHCPLPAPVEKPPREIVRSTCQHSFPENEPSSRCAHCNRTWEETLCDD